MEPSPFKRSGKPSVVVPSGVTPALGYLKQGIHEFRTNLGYSRRMGWFPEKQN